MATYYFFSTRNLRLVLAPTSGPPIFSGCSRRVSNNRRPSTHNLLDDADAADHLNGPVPGGGCRLRDRRFDAVGDEREGQVLVLLRHDAGWSMRQNEDGHL